MYTPETFDMDAVRETILERGRYGLVTDDLLALNCVDAIYQAVSAAGYYPEDAIATTYPVFYTDETHTQRAWLHYIAAFVLTGCPNVKDWMSEDLRVLLLDISLQSKRGAERILSRWPDTLPPEYDQKARQLVGYRKFPVTGGDAW